MNCHFAAAALRTGTVLLVSWLAVAGLRGQQTLRGSESEFTVRQAFGYLALSRNVSHRGPAAGKGAPQAVGDLLQPCVADLREPSEPAPGGGRAGAAELWFGGLGVLLADEGFEALCGPLDDAADVLLAAPAGSLAAWGAADCGWRPRPAGASAGGMVLGPPSVAMVPEPSALLLGWLGLVLGLGRRR